MSYVCLKTWSFDAFCSWCESFVRSLENLRLIARRLCRIVVTVLKMIGKHISAHGLKSKAEMAPHMPQTLIKTFAKYQRCFIQGRTFPTLFPEKDNVERHLVAATNTGHGRLVN